jgi:uncharacterized phage protein (TIGR02218 family)
MIEDLLASPVTSLAYGWRMERRDGVTLGFTSHDCDVVFDGLLLRASPGMEPTSVVERMGFDNGGLDVRGALTSDALAQADIEAGRWDNAALTLFTFDWANLAQPAQQLAAGRLGTISYSGDRFETVFTGPNSVLRKSVAPFTSPTCRANFCDNQCGLNRMRFTREVIAVSNLGDSVALAPGTNLVPGHFATGYLLWLEGPNCGLRSLILSNSANGVTLAASPMDAISLPVRVSLLQGCDKTAATCSSRFANMPNFRGEPHLPGNDILTRYPGAG